VVVYYSRFGKTKIFAQVLGEVCGMDIYELESDLNKKNAFYFMFKALRLAMSGKSFPVLNMPKNLPSEIYLCSPVWGGQIVGSPKYFLENADLRDTKVNVLLTANMPVEKYKTSALELLNKVQCKPGEVYIFATSDKIKPEPETIKEQLQDMLN